LGGSQYLGQMVRSVRPPRSRVTLNKVNGISLYYATIGHGSPVVLLHGGLANSDYWGILDNLRGEHAAPVAAEPAPVSRM
jgi:hypothetical protein